MFSILLNIILLLQASFTPDYYPISNDMLKNESKIKYINNILTIDQAWFRNDSLNEILVIDLYTDYMRLRNVHFKKEYLIKEVSKIIKLNIATGKYRNIFEYAGDSLNIKYLPLFANKARRVSSKYFITSKKFKLGLSSSKIIDLYGSHYSQSNSNEYNILRWHFIGDQVVNSLKDKTGYPIAKNSFGYDITIYFIKDKSVIAIFENVIP
jgi:hypothetical protein